MDDTLRQTQVKWLYCFACGEPFELIGLGATCGCGRSVARLDGGILEIEGPARALAPVETVIRVDGGEWAFVPEDIAIRRRLPGQRSGPCVCSSAGSASRSPNSMATG